MSLSEVQLDPLPPHPEARCQRCGGPNRSWVVDSDRFNVAARAFGLDRGAILCPLCFMEGHEISTGLTATWNLSPAAPFRPVQTHDVSIRPDAQPDSIVPPADLRWVAACSCGWTSEPWPGPSLAMWDGDAHLRAET